LPDKYKLKRAKISAEINVSDVRKGVAKKETTLNNKMYISYNVLHTLPDFNSNGLAYDPERTEETVKTFIDGYINIGHDDWFNVGAIYDSKYISQEQGGKIQADGFLWKNVLRNFDITPQDIIDGKYQISMEVLYKDYYYLVGDEKFDSSKHSELEEFVGQTKEGKPVIRVIFPEEFIGVALTTKPADKDAAIFQAVAKKLESYNNKIDNYKHGGAEEVELFKELKFETEEDYNKHVEKLRQGYVMADEILKKFAELDLEAEKLDDLVKVVADVKEELSTVKSEYEDYKQSVANEKLLNKRLSELSELNITVAEEKHEEIINMSEATFEILLDTAKASVVEDNKEDKETKEAKAEFVDPSLQISDEDKELDVEAVAEGI